MEAHKIAMKISLNCKSQNYFTEVYTCKSVREVLVEDLKLKRRKLDKQQNLKKSVPKGEVNSHHLERNKLKWDQFLVKYTP